MNIEKSLKKKQKIILKEPNYRTKKKKITPEKYKFSTTSLRSRAEMTEDSIAELENISVGFIQYEQQR